MIFDLDGVLADSEIMSFHALKAELEVEGIAIEVDEIRRSFLGRSFPVVAEDLRRRFRPLPGDFEARYRQRVLQAFEEGLQPTPGLREMLARLSVPARVATSSTPVRARRTLEILGLWGRFGMCLDTASEVAQGKPAPDLFLLSAARAGVAPQNCLVIEDSAPGLTAAGRANMASVLYHGGQHHTGRAWEGPSPSLGTLADWTALETLAPGILEDRH